MKDSFRQCMAWLHTWVGLVAGWILFFVFVTGTTGYMDDEITRWMQPEQPLHAQVERDDAAAMLGLALARLETVAPRAKSWTVTLPHASLEPRAQHGLSIAWEEIPQRGHRFGPRGSETLDPDTGEFVHEIEPRATGGGQLLYRMHYLLHYMPGSVGINAVGVATMLMLLAVVTGVITHKKIFTDFFTFRSGKGQRSWLDAHNVISVMSLPFFLMITYTGLVFFTVTYLPAGRAVIYDNADLPPQAYFEGLSPADDEYAPVAMPRIALPALVRAIETDSSVGEMAALQFMHRRGETPSIDVRPAHAGGINFYDPYVARFSAIDGTPLPLDLDSNATITTQRTLFALHEGNFANWWLRWLYFVSGLLGCAVIGTGLVLWTVKRRTQHQKRLAQGNLDSLTAHLNAGGLRLVEILNAGTLVGLPLGVAAYFWANRLLPVDLADRAAWEAHALFCTWGWALLYACLRPIKPAWLELLYLTTAAYALLPLLNVLTTDRHLGITLPYGDWGLAGVDLTMLGSAAAFGYLAFKLKRKWRVTNVEATLPGNSTPQAGHRRSVSTAAESDRRRSASTAAESGREART